jgi:hypothetical protein
LWCGRSSFEAATLAAKIKPETTRGDNHGAILERAAIALDGTFGEDGQRKDRRAPVQALVAATLTPRD